MIRAFSSAVKRKVAIVALAAAVMTLGPALSSFFAFSSEFRPQTPMRGGATIVYKNGPMPTWIAEIVDTAPANVQSAMAGSGQSDRLVPEDRT